MPVVLLATCNTRHITYFRLRHHHPPRILASLRTGDSVAHVLWVDSDRDDGLSLTLCSLGNNTSVVSLVRCV